ncbi:MAG: retropepsin-like aspartic protease [bacterium]|nr:retropepsin-like aspartic protease [bacterium]
MPDNFSPPIRVYYEAVTGTTLPLWPILDIELSFNGKVIPWKISALVDSGASGSVITSDLAKTLGFDLSKEKNIRGEGVSGVYKGKELKAAVDIDIYGYKHSFRFTTIEKMPWDCILGEDSIFQVAKLDFQRFKGFFEIRFREDIN